MIYQLFIRWFIGDISNYLLGIINHLITGRGAPPCFHIRGMGLAKTKCYGSQKFLDTPCSDWRLPCTVCPCFLPRDTRLEPYRHGEPINLGKLIPRIPSDSEIYAVGVGSHDPCWNKCEDLSPNSHPIGNLHLQMHMGKLSWVPLMVSHHFTFSKCHFGDCWPVFTTPKPGDRNIVQGWWCQRPVMFIGL